MTNRGVAYIGPGKVEVQSIDFPKLALGSRKCEHGVILKVVSTNICGSDQHMVRGRTTAPKGLVLGHDVYRSGPSLAPPAALHKQKGHDDKQQCQRAQAEQYHHSHLSGRGGGRGR